MIFDEATSALDKKNEQEVQKAIDEMKKELVDVTCIVIAHRLSTVRNADNIIVMKNGQIAEQGDHETLLRKFPSGVYSRLVADQQKLDEDSQKRGKDQHS